MMNFNALRSHDENVAATQQPGAFVKAKKQSLN
jgi:hypothetical protein